MVHKHFLNQPTELQALSYVPVFIVSSAVSATYMKDIDITSLRSNPLISLIYVFVVKPFNERNTYQLTFNKDDSIVF